MFSKLAKTVMSDQLYKKILSGTSYDMDTRMSTVKFKTNRQIVHYQKIKRMVGQARDGLTSLDEGIPVDGSEGKALHYLKDSYGDVLEKIAFVDEDLYARSSPEGKLALLRDLF